MVKGDRKRKHEKNHDSDDDTEEQQTSREGYVVLSKGLK